MEYTHEIQWFGRKLKCFVYKNIEEQNGMVYIRTEDNRSCWWDKNKLRQLAVIGSCCEIVERKRGFIYADEECGNKAKIEIEYTINNKLVKKQLCMKHYKSVTAWLDRIKVSYNCL